MTNKEEVVEKFEKIYSVLDDVTQGIVLSKLYLGLKDKDKFFSFVQWERKKK